MFDDTYPNDGSTFYQPFIQDEEKQAEVRQEKAQIADELPIIKAATTYLRERVTKLKSIDGIPQHVLNRPEEFMHLVAGNKVAAEELEQILTWFEALIKSEESTQ